MIYVLSGGGSGATLVITGVAGDTCTITKDGKTKSKTFGSDDKATFKGLDTGTWTVIMTNISGSTATRTVTINADYTLAISYFSATIAVTYPAGSTCTCTDGNTTLTAVGTTGSYTFTVGNTGTWTVSCTDGTDTASESVSITTDGQSANLELRYDMPLWDSGSVNEDVTGGWSGNSANTNNCGTDYEKYLYIQSSAYGAVTAKTVNMIDVTKFNTLKVNVVAFSKSGGNGKVGLSTNGTNPNDNVAASQAFSSNITTPTEFSIDISLLSGEYCVFMWGDGGNNNYGQNMWACSLKVDRIILE